MNKVQTNRVQRPLHWSLEHYPYVPAWGSFQPRQETRLEAYQGLVAASHWYSERYWQALQQHDMSTANGYRKLAANSYDAAEYYGSRCK